MNLVKIHSVFKFFFRRNDFFFTEYLIIPFNKKGLYEKVNDGFNAVFLNKIYKIFGTRVASGFEKIHRNNESD